MSSKRMVSLSPRSDAPPVLDGAQILESTSFRALLFDSWCGICTVITQGCCVLSGSLHRYHPHKGVIGLVYVTNGYLMEVGWSLIRAFHSCAHDVLRCG